MAVGSPGLRISRWGCRLGEVIPDGLTEFASLEIEGVLQAASPSRLPWTSESGEDGKYFTKTSPGQDTQKDR